VTVRLLDLEECDSGKRSTRFDLSNHGNSGNWVVVSAPVFFGEDSIDGVRVSSRRHATYGANFRALDMLVNAKLYHVTVESMTVETVVRCQR